MAKTFQNSKGQVIGVLDGNFFRKNVSKKKHLLRVMDAWGIDTSVLKQLPAGCNIVITDVDTMTVYISTVDTFIERGIHREFGYGQQVFLPRNYFNFNEKTLFNS